MATSTTWTLFDPATVPEQPIPGHEGLFGRALVDNTDEGGSSLLGVRYEPGAGDDDRRHAVGQVVLVLDGDLAIDGRPCGPGAGAFVPAGRSSSLRAGSSGATAVEFRPAPIVYLSGDDDAATMHVKPPTPEDPRYAWDVMQSAGPVTSVHELSYFDVHSMPEKVLSPVMSIQALVNHAEDNGQSMLTVHHAPGYVQEAHSHDVEQIVVVLEGTLVQGNRTFGAATGFFTPKGRNYTFSATDDRDLIRVEWRPSPLRFATDFTERSAS
jgi:hypothetical protein